MEMTALEKKWAEEASAHVPSLNDAYDKEGSLIVEKIEQKVMDRIPTPTGWRIVILPYRGAEKTKGGIVLSDQTRQREQSATVCGYVLAVGPLAYADENKFPTGPWCKKGDWIVFGRYAGARLPIDEGEIRIINDDEVLALIQNPEDIVHL
jgi:co-chaperonin GroES (HSP10)